MNDHIFKIEHCNDFDVFKAVDPLPLLSTMCTIFVDAVLVGTLKYSANFGYYF